MPPPACRPGVRQVLSYGRRLLGRVRRELRALAEKRRNRQQPTFIPAGAALPAQGRFAFVDQDFVAALAADFPDFPELLRRQADDALEHRFDLLGSGPTVVAHGTPCRGVEGIAYAMSLPVHADRAGNWLAGRINAANLAESQRLWRLVDAGYVPIDWQLDFKSGYRWREDCWHRDIRFADSAGVDVKVPWELARCQHLPALALACHFAAGGHPGFRSIEDYACALRNQALDFFATNPPGFGVNWACAMDVAIRATNLLLARDIALAAGVRFDAEFEAAFAATLRAHGRHVVANLEWAPRHRGNHYLADVAGLAFIAAGLPGDAEVDAWLAFATQELVAEIDYQFHADGSNFEASVCYHRLSAEIVLWTAALLADLPPEKKAALQRPQRHRALPRLRAEALPLHALPWGGGESPLTAGCWQRLARMAGFTRALTRPDGLVVQFGDNDSGRFVTLGSGEQLRAGNDPAAPAWSLDHGALVAGIDALLRTAAGHAADPAARLVCGLAGRSVGAAVFAPAAPVSAVAATGARPATPAAADDLAPPVAPFADEHAWADASARRAAAGSRWTSRFAASLSSYPLHLSAGLECASFPGIGCYVLRGPRLYLAIRCGEIGLAGLGAHAHCDQLAIELVIDGETRVRDPGSYLYTALPDRRNAYRSVAAHHAPRVAGREPADLTRHLFDLRGAAEGQCLYFGPRGFVGRHAGYGAWVWRQIVVDEEGIDVHDYCAADGGEPALLLADPTPQQLPFSPAYGRLLESAPR